MRSLRWMLCLGLLLGFLATALVSTQVLAEEPGCSEAVALIRSENSKLSGDLRRIQREIAALRADLDEPGMREVFGGLGYILGLFGVAFFIAARRRG